MSQLVVGTAMKQIVPYNPKRLSLAIFNGGTEAIYLSNDRNLSTANGFYLGNGVTLTSIRALGGNPQDELNGIAPTTNNTIGIYETFDQGAVT